MAEQYFEMLWDCGRCGTRGLLGKSQRHCPQCGSAQAPEKRYFPEPGKEVEAMGHRYVGADWKCAYCDSPNSAAAAFCVNCGGPKDGTREVTRVQEEPPVPMPPAAPAPGSSGFPWIRVLLGLLLVAGVTLGYFFFSKHDEAVQVAERTWNREVDVERFTAVNDAAWCDALPAGAYQITRSREQRSTRQVEAGQECRDKRVDKGDGTFTKQQECTPRYRDEPVYDMKCRYRINRWQVARTDRLAGDYSLAPVWPSPSLAHAFAGREALGVERLGSRREHYRARLKSDRGREWICDLDAGTWSALEQGRQAKLKVRGTGGADCASLAAAQ